MSRNAPYPPPANVGGLDRWLAIFFVLAACLYLAILLGAGRFLTNDELFFKAAGREWAASGQFAAPELSGALDSSPPPEEIYALYPPAYPFLFGLFVKLIGFGWRSVVLFDGLIHLYLCCATIWIARTIAPEAGRWRAFLAGLTILPLGTYGRPDELAMCFGMAACGLVLTPEITKTRNVWSGALLGLCCATSVGAALAFSCIWVALRAGALRSKPWRVAGSEFLLAVFSGLVALVACLSPILISHPGAYDWFLATVIKTAASRPLLATWMETARLNGFMLAAVAGIVSSALLLASVVREERRKDVWRLTSGSILVLGLMLYLARGKYTYLWFTTPWLLAAVFSIAGSSRFGSSSWPRTIATQIALLAVLIGAIPYVRSSWMLLSLPDEQTLPYNVKHLQRLIPPGTVAMGDVAWLAVADRNRVYDTEFASAGTSNLARTDFVVLTGNGTGRPGYRWLLSPDQEEYLARHFHVLENRLPKAPLTILGHRFSHSAYGFGTIVFVRDDQRPRD